MKINSLVLILYMNKRLQVQPRYDRFMLNKWMLMTSIASSKAAYGHIESSYVGIERLGLVSEIYIIFQTCQITGKAGGSSSMIAS